MLDFGVCLERLPRSTTLYSQWQ